MTWYDISFVKYSQNHEFVFDLLMNHLISRFQNIKMPSQTSSYSFLQLSTDMKESAVKVRMEKMLSMLENVVKEPFKGHLCYFQKDELLLWLWNYFERKDKEYYVLALSR